MILIYSDSQLLDLEWIKFLNFKQPVTVVHDFTEYQTTTADYKIAFTSARLHCDYDRDCKVYKGFEDKVRRLSAVSNLVFSLESELHNFHWHIWAQCHNHNVYWILPGNVNDKPDMSKHIIYWGDFFKLVDLLYKKLPNKLAELTPYTVKPKYFDALLGSPKPHRQFVFDSVIEHKLQDKFIIPYGGDWKNDEFYAKDYFIWEPGCVPETNIIGTADSVNYLGHSTPLSHIIPISVYNNTAYSILTETDFDNTLSFFSEKTAKIFLARRLFVVFSGYKFLHNLRNLGFKTFDGIIDESYDLILDGKQRYTAAFAQVKYLCSTPQAEILVQIKDIVEYNYDLLTTTDWTKFARDQVQDQINLLLATAD